MKKIIVVLAKSAKYGGYCVAGIELGTNRWIRPVTHDENTQGAVPADAIVYADKTEIQPLDVVQIEFASADASEVQPENFFYTAETWKKFGRWSMSDFEKFCGLDSTDYIFYDDARRIEPKVVSTFDVDARRSLMILPVENVSVITEMSNDEKKIRASFDYNGTRYERFGVGDIALREEFSARDCGEFFLAERAIATFSLAKPYKDGRCYKILAQLWSHSD